MALALALVVILTLMHPYPTLPDKIVVRETPMGVVSGLYWTNINPLTGVSQLIGSDLDGLNPVVMVSQLIALQQLVQLTVDVSTLVQAVSGSSVMDSL